MEDLELAHESAELWCHDGWRLSLKVIAPARPRVAAIVGHAMMVDRRTLDPRGEGLIAHLTRRGIAVVWPDLRGHGESGPRAEAGGSWDYDDLVEQDTTALVELSRRRFPGLPLYAVGHSLFGHVALAHAARHPDRTVDGLVLLAANVWGRRWEPRRLRWWTKRFTIELMGGVTRLAGRFPSRRLGIGSNDEAARYVEQTVAFVRGEWRSRDGFSYTEALARLRLPVLSLTGRADRLLCAPESAARFIAEVPGARHLEVGAGGDVTTGGWLGPDHMGIVLDRRSAPAWDRIAEFLLDPVSTLAAPGPG